MGIAGTGKTKHANPSVFIRFSSTPENDLDEVERASWKAVEKMYHPARVVFDPRDPPLDGEGDSMCARWKGDVKRKPRQLGRPEVIQYRHINESFTAALDYERTHNLIFHYFARVRFDITFGRPLPGLRELYPPSSPNNTQWYTPARANDLVSDHFALLPRAAATSYFTIASTLFINCTSMKVDARGRTSGELLVYKAMGEWPRRTLPTCWFSVRNYPGHIPPWNSQGADPTCKRELEGFRRSCRTR
mmetsp:Transcript_9302/g.23298  ORF Transcript_9302/g.23298 Transcript_9302/m.23298 type:complete len:247 (+) Transcript_9302:488-1228(+)